MKRHVIILAALLGLGVFLSFTKSSALINGTVRAQKSTVPFERITVNATGRGNPHINLDNGLDVPVIYSGALNTQDLLLQNQARPLTLDSADFDEDGVPDLIAGFAGPRSGIVTVYRGNIDSIFPNGPDAKRRKADGQFIDSAFLPQAYVVEIPEPADFLGVGDFDADGHLDAVTAAKGGDSLYFLRGNGRGEFEKAQRIGLGGRATALVTGEINRADGLADVVVGIMAPDGPKALIFEGPREALLSSPEQFPLQSEAEALALGQLDDEYTIDLAVAAGGELVIIYGRDRRLSHTEANRAQVRQARIDRYGFPFSIKSIAIGDFTGTHKKAIALLSSDGALHLVRETGTRGNGARKEAHSGKSEILSANRLPAAGRLICARISGRPSDDLLIIDEAGRHLHIMVDDSNQQSGHLRALVSLDTENAPVAVLPMRLNPDALSDLVILQQGSSSPSVVMTKAPMTFTVNTADDHDDGLCDAGDCTLREAINAANANMGVDTILFNIPGAGVRTILPIAVLPTITDPVTIDGTTQPGFAGLPLIELNGQTTGIGDGVDGNGLTITSGGSTIRSLVVRSFGQFGITLEMNGGNILEGNFLGTNSSGTARGFNINEGLAIIFSSNNLIGGTTALARNLMSGNAGSEMFINGSENHIQGNFIGTDVTGTTAIFSNSNAGIDIGAFSANNVIGGTTPGARNVISGNSNAISLFSTTAIGTQIQGNYLGTDLTGTVVIGNGAGVNVSQAINTLIGGTTPGGRNLISGNFFGISLLGPNTTIQGNYIGTDVSGTAALGNQAGILLIGFTDDNLIGGTTNAAGNIIAFSTFAGVGVGSNLRNSILHNSIFSNGSLGIDIAANGVTLNDPCDLDTGGNDGQNFPVLTSATSNGNSINIQGTLNSTPAQGTTNGTPTTIEFFANTECDPSGFGEGKTFIGSTTVTIDSNCNASINVNFTVAVPIGQFITATATDGAGNTSEFSQCLTVTAGFDICVQNDGSGDTLSINSQTGEYLFTKCGSDGFSLSGVGALTIRGCSIILEHNPGNRKVRADINTCTKRASASVKVPSLGKTFSLADRDITNNTCTCPAGP